MYGTLAVSHKLCSVCGNTEQVHSGLKTVKELFIGKIILGKKDPGGQ